MKRQVGWMSPTTGVMCDCPVYERSPHANSVPIYVEEPACAQQAQAVGSSNEPPTNGSSEARA